jgi:hypothetical protein
MIEFKSINEFMLWVEQFKKEGGNCDNKLKILIYTDNLIYSSPSQIIKVTNNESDKN